MSSTPRSWKELYDLANDYFGLNSYEADSILETFFAYNFDVNEPEFVYQLNQRELFFEGEWEDWFLRNGGDERLIEY